MDEHNEDVASRARHNLGLGALLDIRSFFVYVFANGDGHHGEAVDDHLVPNAYV
jgi:hypothetical protein